MTRRLAVLLAIAMAASLTVIGRAGATSSTRRVVPLVSWWNHERGDNFTTSDPRWSDSTAPRAGYVFVRDEGLVFDPAAPQPADTVPLHSWWNEDRLDNFITSDPRWIPRSADEVRDGYRYVRLEGYVYSINVAGTLPLESWYSGSRKDNFATANPDWFPTVPGATRAGYGAVRREGFLLPPAVPQRPLAASDFGYEKLRASGNRRLLVVLVEYRWLTSTSGVIVDNRIRFPQANPNGFFDAFVFGPGRVPDYFRQVSKGSFTFTRAGVVGPVTVWAAQPRAPVDNVKDAISMAAAAGFDFSSYDTDNNGTITAEELTILMIDAGTVSWGQSPYVCDLQIKEGLQYCGKTAAGPQHSRLSNWLHELGHGIGKRDFYGDVCNNTMLTVASCTAGGNNQVDPHWFDPIHLSWWGWSRPRPAAVTPAGACETIAAPQYASRYEGSVFLYDPSISSSGAAARRRFFALQYRNPRLGGMDANAPGRGLAIWDVGLNDDGFPPEIPGVLIEPGPDGSLDTVPNPSSDDGVVGGFADGVNRVGPGANGVLETAPDSRDRLGTAAHAFTLGAPNAYRGAPNNFGGGAGLWTAVNGAFRLRMSLNNWLATGAADAIEFKVGPENDGSFAAGVQWSRGGAFRPRLDRLGVGTTGRLLVVEGVLGVDAASKSAFLVAGSARHPVDLELRGCREAWVRVPSGVPAGAYDLVVQEATPGGVMASNRLRVNVGSA